MTLVRMAAIVAAFFVLAGAMPAKASEALGALNKQVDQTNFIVDRGCSGTLVSLTQRLILTNAHCVDQFIRVVTRDRTGPDGKVKKVRSERRDPVTVHQKAYKGHERVGSSSYVTEIVAFRKNRDLAVLQMKAETIPHTEVSAFLADDAEITRGERVYVVGNPAGLDATVVEGVISSLTRSFRFPWTENEELPMIQFSGGAYGGNSGGALYNDKRQLIGVPAAGHSQATFIGLAIPIDIVKETLREECFASVWDRTADDEACRAEKIDDDDDTSDDEG